MLCKRCMTVMGTGTTYERREDDQKQLARRFYECKKCHDRVYVNAPNFQEYMNRLSEKN